MNPYTRVENFQRYHHAHERIPHSVVVDAVRKVLREPEMMLYIQALVLERAAQEH